MSRPQPVYVGVDAGGTRTRVVVADASLRPIATLEGGAGNARRAAADVVADDLLAQVRGALERARLAEPELIALGVAGASGPAFDALATALRARTAAAIELMTDSEALLAGIGGDPLSAPAVALVAGTGSGAIGRDGRGAVAGAGGHGLALGDEGSAAWIGREALRAVLRAADGRDPPTALGAALCDHLEIASPALRELALQMASSAPALGQLAPLVSAASARGDRTARAIEERAASELFLLARTVIDRLDLASSPFSIALAGGVLEGSEGVRGLTRAHLHRHAPDAAIDPPRLPPALGAIRLALARRAASCA